MKSITFVFAILTATLLVAGCGQFERNVAKWTGYSKICVEGVRYLQFTSGASVQYSPDGKIVTCEK